MNQQVGVYIWILKWKQDTGTKYYCHCIVNVHIIHHSECSNRVLMPFPRISNHTMQYTHSVCNLITTNKRVFCSGQMFIPFPRIYQWTSRSELNFAEDSLQSGRTIWKTRDCMGGQNEVWIIWNEILRKTDSSEANYVPALERKYNFFHYGRFDILNRFGFVPRPFHFI